MKISTGAMLAIIAASFIIGICLYPGMPEHMPSHWNALGEVDGYMPKFWALFIMPFVSIGLLLLFLAIPRIDPLKRNLERFRKYFDGLVVLIMALLFYLYLLVLAWNTGFRFNMGQMMAPALGLLFICIGAVMGRFRRNWFVGIKTPWTLSSDRVWKKTHRVGGRVFLASGIIALFGIAFPDYAIWLILAPILVGVVYTVVYSYFDYQKLGKK